MSQIGRRGALRLLSGASVLAGGAWWGADWARGFERRSVQGGPLRLRFRSGGTAFWAALSGDGRQVVWYDDWRVRIADADGAGMRTLCEASGLYRDASNPHTAAFTADGRYFVAVIQDRLVRLRLDNGARDAEAPVPPGTRLLDVTRDGARALVTLPAPLAALATVDLGAHRVIGHIAHAPPRLAWLVETGTQILMGDGGNGEPELWSVETGEALPSPWRKTPGVVSAHIVGSRVALFCRDGWVRWLGGGRPLETPLRRVDQIGGDDSAPTLRIDGTLLALGTTGMRGSLMVGPDGRRKASAPGESVLALSGRGDYVLVRGESPREVVFGQLSTGREWPLAAAGAGASGASFSRDGGRLAVAAVSGILVYEVSRPTPARPAP